MADAVRVGLELCLVTSKNCAGSVSGLLDESEEYQLLSCFWAYDAESDIIREPSIEVSGVIGLAGCALELISCF